MYKNNNTIEKECYNIIKKLIRVKTFNPPGNEMDIVEVILSYFPKEKIKYEVIDHGSNRGSLVITLPGKNQDEAIAFIGHIDTVPVGNICDWKYPPFDAVRDGEYVYGRGSSDMKGGVCAMILTAKYFIDNSIIPNKTIHFCFTADEERDGTGVLAIREMGLITNAVEIFISEPSCVKLGLVEKGALWLKISVNGREAHASMPDCGINAIEKLMKFINNIKELIDLEKSNEYLGTSSLAVTKIKGGVNTNMIPAFAEASVDIRTIPGMNHDDIIIKANEIAKDMMKKEEILIDIKIENNRPAVGIDKNHPFINKLRSVYSGLNYQCEEKGIYFYTDASQLIPYMNVPFVILGPGDDALAHQRDERIKVSSILEVIEIYINYILNTNGEEN
jgi:succinyl-diaminopimelate desuccinylase